MMNTGEDKSPVPAQYVASNVDSKEKQSRHRPRQSQFTTLAQATPEAEVEEEQLAAPGNHHQQNGHDRHKRMNSEDVHDSSSEGAMSEGIKLRNGFDNQKDKDAIE